MTDDNLLWQVRAYIYNYFADRTRPPGVEETARYFNLKVEEAGTLYRELNTRHALFLEPDTLSIQMANPFSAIRTDFRVRANGKSYFANCAWDMFGIPAALHSDAVINVISADSLDLISLQIRNGQVSASDLKIHFPLPFTRWYNDLAYT